MFELVLLCVIVFITCILNLSNLKLDKNTEKLIYFDEHNATLSESDNQNVRRSKESSEDNDVNVEEHFSEKMESKTEQEMAEDLINSLFEEGDNDFL